MNALSKQFKTELVQTNQFCPKHNELMVLLIGRPVCQTCANEAYVKSQIEHAHQVNLMVREKHFAGAKLLSATRKADLKIIW